MKSTNLSLSVIGLGYVGLPLAVEFGKKRDVIGFDINLNRIKQLKSNKDTTLEVSSQELQESKNLSFTAEAKDLKGCNCFIIAVPTPIDKNNIPDMSILLSASETVGKFLDKGDIVIYESTVYPGATEEDCVPILERESRLKYNVDFFCGYSPERINPGDKEHRIKDIQKVTSGSTEDVAQVVDDLYNEIIIAGTYKAESIKVAEAAKVIENTQRDLNIALINELSIIFNKMDIDTQEVLRAAQTKWNFIPYTPGLVGGHCIGVDPYYLTHKSESLGYKPEIILAGRKLNDQMSSKVSENLLSELSKFMDPKDSNILILGFSFKENCTDLRNTKIVDLYESLDIHASCVDVYDPYVSKEEAYDEYGINLLEELGSQKYDGIVIAVSHEEFRTLGIEGIKRYAKERSVIYDLKFLFDKSETDLRL